MRVSAVGFFLLLWGIGTILALVKAKTPADTALVLAPSLLVVIAYGAQPYLIEIHGLMLKMGCLFLAACLPVVARAYLESKQKRADEAAQDVSGK